MPDNYLFELVLAARDEASPSIQQLRDQLTALQATLQAVGGQAQQTSTVQAAASKAAADAGKAARDQAIADAQAELEAARQAYEQGVAAQKQALDQQRAAENNYANLVRSLLQQETEARKTAANTTDPAQKQAAEQEVAAIRDAASQELAVRRQAVEDAKTAYAEQTQAAQQAAQDQIAAEKALQEAMRPTSDAQQALKAAIAERTALTKQAAQDETAARKTAAETSKQLDQEVTAADKAVATAAKDAANAGKDGASLLGSAFSGLGGIFSEVTQGIGLGLGILVPQSIAAATAAIVQFSTDSVKSFADYDKAIREINTVTSQFGAAGQAQYAALSHDILDFSARMGVDAKQSAEAMYQAVSSGFNKAADSQLVLEAATKLSIAGLTDQATTTKAVTAVLNDYGLNATHAGEVSDILFTAVQNGRVRIDELGNSLGKVAPFASKAGISLNEVVAAEAAMTAQGIDASTAATNVINILNAFVNPSDKAKKAAADMKIELDAEALAHKGLAGVIQDVNEKTGGQIDQIARVIPNLRGLRGEVDLTGEGWTKLVDITQKSTDNFGVVDKAVEEVNKSGSRQIEEFTAKWDALKIKIGGELMPVLSDVLDFITKVGEKLGAWPASVPSDEQLARMQKFSGAVQVTATGLSALGDVLGVVWKGLEQGKSPTQSVLEGLTALGLGLADHAQKAASDAIATIGLSKTYDEHKQRAEELGVATSTLTRAQADSVDVEDRRAKSLASLKAAVEQHTEATHKQTQAEIDHAAQLASIDQLQKANIISAEDADQRRARADADLAKAQKDGTAAVNEQDRAMQELLRDTAAGTSNLGAFSQKTTEAHQALKNMTEADYESRIKAIAEQWASGAITMGDATKQMSADTGQYEQALDEAARKADEDAKKIADALKSADEEYTKFTDDVARAVRDGNEKIVALRQQAEVEIQHDLQSSAEEQRKIRGKEADDELKEQQTFLQKFGELQKQKTDLETGADEASQQERLKHQQALEAFNQANLQAFQKYNDDTVKANRDANEKLAELDRQYGKNGSGGQAAADDQRERDRTIADARAKLVEDGKNEELQLTERNADAQRVLNEANADEQRRLDEATADARQARDQAVADAEAKLLDAQAQAQQQLADKLAQAQQKQADAIAKEYADLTKQAQDDAQKLITALTDPNNAEGKAARQKAQADEEAKYEQQLADESAQHTKALHDAQSTADLAAEQARHDLATKNLQDEHLAAQAGPGDAQAKLQAGADAETARYRNTLDAELTTHEQHRDAATTDAAKAAERDRHTAAQQQIEQEHADRLKALADESGLETDAQKKQADDAAKARDLQKRQALSELQDQYDEAKKQADDAEADALKKAQEVHDDALKKAQQEYQDKLDKAQRAYDDAKAKAEQAHKDALARNQQEHDDAVAKQRQQFADLKQQQADAHADALVKIAEQYTKERTAAIQNRDDRFKDIDTAWERETTNRKTDFEQQQKDEAAAFKLRQDHDLEQANTRLGQLQTEHEKALQNITAQADKDVAENNRALDLKVQAVLDQRGRDYDKFDQDLKDRMTDLLTQFTDTVNKMAEKIPDKVNRVLSGAASAAASGTANVEGAIPSAAIRPGGKPGETPDEVRNFFINSGSSPQEAQQKVNALLTGQGAGDAFGVALAPLQVERPQAPDLDKLYDDFMAIVEAARKAYRETAQADDQSFGNQQLKKGVYGGDAAADTGQRVDTAGTSGSASTEQALNWAMNRVGQAIYEGACEKFVENAYNTTGQYASAWAAAQHLMQHPGGSLGDVPRGDLVFFRPDSSNGGYGHVGIALGGGRFVSALYSGIAVQGPAPYWNNLFAGYGAPTYRAFGGPGEAGQAYLVGERTSSPEVYVPQQPGQFHTSVESIFNYDKLAGAIAQAIAPLLSGLLQPALLAGAISQAMAPLLSSFMPPAVQPALPSRAPVTVNVNGANPQAIIREIDRQQRRQDLLDRAVLQGVA